LLYLRQEGRGIGLSNKLKAYHLQDLGRDTVQANIELGFAPDLRDFKIVSTILEQLGIDSIRLLTNNPNKLSSFDSTSIKVSERIPLVIPPSSYSACYLKTKKDKMGHLL
jgi:3,4-dihydroxy 2-butanone 4-phosphate synthase/GTP cyclohydrolase II